MWIFSPFILKKVKEMKLVWLGYQLAHRVGSGSMSCSDKPQPQLGISLLCAMALCSTNTRGEAAGWQL